MKIVFTTHAYWPKKNGVQYVNQYMAEGLVHLGHEVLVITNHTDSKEERQYEHNGVKIIDLYLKTRYSIFYFGKKEYVERVLNLVNKCDCLINVCVQAPNNNVLLPFLKKISCKKILYMHGMHDFKHVKISSSSLRYYFWHIFMNIRWRLFYYMNRYNFLEYDHMIDIHNKSDTIQFMKKLGYKKNIVIISNAVEDFDKIQINTNDTSNLKYLDTPFFLNIANFTELKNQAMIIEAFNMIREQTDYNLVLIGGASDYSRYIEQLVNKYSLNDRVLILKDYNREDTIKYIKCAKCGILSSHKEVFPIFIGETIACKHPYISTDVGCLRNIPGGILVNNVEEMASAMLSIQDQFRYDELSSLGYRYALDNLKQSTKIAKLNDLISNR